MNCKIKRTKKNQNDYSVTFTGLTRGNILALHNALNTYSQAGSAVAGDVLAFLTNGIMASEDAEVKELLE